MSIRFNLKWLLFLVAFVGGLLAIAMHVGMGTAEFEVWANELELNERGLVQGRLCCGYMGTESDSSAPWPFDVEINNIRESDLIQIKPGKKVEICYRMVSLGPFEKQDPFEMYLRRIGVDVGNVVGHVITNTGTKVIVDGFRND